MKQNKIRLLNELRRDSRRSLTEISIRTGIPLSSVFKILARLEKELICRYAAFVDFTKLGYPLKTGVFLKAAIKNELEDFLSRNPSLNTFLRVSGEYDYFAELLFRDMKDCQDFIDSLKDNELIKKLEA